MLAKFSLALQSLFVLRENPNQIRKPHAPFPRLAADFEPQRALVLSVSDWQPHHAPVFQQIVEKTHSHVEVLVLCNTREQFHMALSWLDKMSERSDHVHFALLELDTIWLRDFAPLVAETKDGKAQLLDFLYAGERPKDDRLPMAWAQRTLTQPVQVPYTLQGGNLLCNGQHLAIATSRIFVDNAITFPYPTPGMDTVYEGRKIVFEDFLKYCNLQQFIILEHLQEEATKHVDMFATFISPHQVVVASVDQRFDPVNAGILDRNARRLQTVKVNDRPLEVHRLPIPPRNGQSWSAFTNVIFANDLVLMPIFDSDPKPMIDAAVSFYQKLLPKHTIKTVDITSFKQLQGELHCLSMNLPKFGPWLPNTSSFKDAMQAVKNGKIKLPEHRAVTQPVNQPGTQTEIGGQRQLPQGYGREGYVQPGYPQRNYGQPVPYGYQRQYRQPSNYPRRYDPYR